MEKRRQSETKQEASMELLPMVEDAVQMTEVDAKKSKQKNDGLMYKVDDKPPLHLCVLFALQQCLLSMFSSMVYPLIYAPHLCIPNDDYGNRVKAILAGSILVGDGVSTLLQTTFGTRLPIIQGSSFAFVFPTISLMLLPRNLCPDPLGPNLTSSSSDLINITGAPTATMTTTQNVQSSPLMQLYNDTNGRIVDSDELWMSRMNEVQGGLILSASFECLCGFFGIVGKLTKLVGPLTITACITMIGLDLVSVVPHHAQYSWPVAFFTAVVLAITSTYMSNVTIPYPTYSRTKRAIKKGQSQFFKLFPVLIAIGLGWLLSYILTIYNVFPDDPKSETYLARTDAKMNSLGSSPWFRLPFPLQFGLPKFTVAAFAGMMAGTIASVIESIGDYNACAAFCETPSPLPKHATNRGILMEGLGCIWTGILGTGTGTTSYSQNVAAVQITKVASRRVGQVAGLLLIAIGCFTKVGAFIFTIPEPVFGGVFIILFGMIIAVGLANLQTVDLTSSRNLFVIGCSFFIGRLIPACIGDGTLQVATGNQDADQVLLILLQSSLFMGSITAAIIDNTLPGTRAERGFDSKVKTTDQREAEKCYDPPYFVNSWFSKYLFICPGSREENYDNVDSKEDAINSAV